MDLAEIFKILPFSTAVCVVLFIFCFKIFQAQNKRMDENARDAQALQDRYINHLQNTNEKLIKCINDNTEAFRQVIDVLQEVESKLKEFNHVRQQ